GLATVPSAEASAYCRDQVPLVTEPMIGVGVVMTVPSGRAVLTCGGGGRTVKPVRVTVSVPVVSVTSRAPAAATGSIVMTVVTLVAEFTVTESTEIPAPKSAVVVP